MTEIQEIVRCAAGDLRNQERVHTEEEKIFDDPELQNLLKRRKETRDSAMRRNLTMVIRKLTRKLTRKKKSQKIDAILAEFKGLDRIEYTKLFSIKRKIPSDHNALKPDDFASFLQGIFKSDR